MNSSRRLQLIVIGCSVILFVLLYFANKKPEKKAEDMPQKQNAEAVIDIKTFVDAQISTLPDTLKKVFAGLDKNIADTNGINVIVEFLKEQKMIVPATYYYEKKISPHKYSQKLADGRQPLLLRSRLRTG